MRVSGARDDYFRKGGVLTMAVIESEKVTKVKLVSMKLGLDGAQHQSTRTFSNIVNGVPNDALFNGMNAVIGLLEQVPSAVVRVEEANLSQE